MNEVNGASGKFGIKTAEKTEVLIRKMEILKILKIFPHGSHLIAHFVPFDTFNSWNI